MKIGNLTVENPLFLAPMAGVTDWAFRTVCAKLGAGVTVTEMVSSRALVYQDKKTAKLLRTDTGEMSEEEKNSVSHRNRSVLQMRPHLRCACGEQLP